MSRKPKSYPWNPDFVVAPGETLKEWLDETHLPIRSVARLARLTEDELKKVMDASLMIDERIGQGLENATGISARFWYALEGNYRAGLARGLKPLGTTDNSKEPT